MNANAFCFVSISPLRKEASDRAEIVTQLLFGEIIEIIEIKENWTKIITFHDHYEGYIDTKHFIKLSPKEVKKWLDNQLLLPNLCLDIQTPWGKQTIVRGSFIGSTTNFSIGNHSFSCDGQIEKLNEQNPFDFALHYLNTSYLWGGKSPFGIDCSGLTQMVYRFFEISLPRDASQQVQDGLPIPFDEVEKNDLVFFHNKEGKVIHVGIMGSNFQIIHASGHVRIDKLTPIGIFNEEKQTITHNLHAIKRFI